MTNRKAQAIRAALVLMRSDRDVVRIISQRMHDQGFFKTEIASALHEITFALYPALEE